MIKRTLLNRSIDELETILQREYLKLSDKLMSYLLDLYVSILGEGGTPLHSHLYQFNKYYEMLNKIQTESNTFNPLRTSKQAPIRYPGNLFLTLTLTMTLTGLRNVYPPAGS